MCVSCEWLWVRGKVVDEWFFTNVYRVNWNKLFRCIHTTHTISLLSSGRNAWFFGSIQRNTYKIYWTDSLFTYFKWDGRIQSFSHLFFFVFVFFVVSFSVRTSLSFHLDLLHQFVTKVRRTKKEHMQPILLKIFYQFFPIFLANKSKGYIRTDNKHSTHKFTYIQDEMIHQIPIHVMSSEHIT